MKSQMSAKAKFASGAKKILVLTSLFLIAGSASAAELVAPKSKDNPNLNISASETHKNLYAAAPNLTINAKTSGDLTAAGGTVTLEGVVEDGLLLAGGNLYVNGPVGGNARVVGGNINISTSIGGDLVVLGGNITISEKASIGGDLVIAGGNVVLNAPVKGSIKFAGGDLTVNSKVEGGISARVSNRLVFGPNAQVAQKISYKAPKAAFVDPSAKLSAIVFTLDAQKSSRKIAAVFTAALVIKLLAWMLAAWLILKIRPKRANEISAEMQKKPWQTLGIGLLALIAWPIATFLVLITAVGYYVAIILAVIYMLLLLLTSLLSAIFLGRLAMHYLTKASETVPVWQIAVLGVLLWQLLSYVPILGWLACAVVFLMVFGSVILMLKQQIKIQD